MLNRPWGRRFSISHALAKFSIASSRPPRKDPHILVVWAVYRCRLGMWSAQNTENSKIFGGGGLPYIYIYVHVYIYRYIDMFAERGEFVCEYMVCMLFEFLYVEPSRLESAEPKNNLDISRWARSRPTFGIPVCTVGFCAWLESERRYLLVSDCLHQRPFSGAFYLLLPHLIVVVSLLRLMWLRV